MIFVGNREDRVTTKAGHTIYFPATGAEVFVPDVPEVIKAVTARGHLPKAVSVKPPAKFEMIEDVKPSTKQKTG